MNEYAELIEDVRKIKTDLYIGEGKDNPPVTTRLALLERGQDMTLEKLEKYDALLNKAIWFSLSTLAVVVGFLVKAIFFSHT